MILLVKTTIELSSFVSYWAGVVGQVPIEWANQSMKRRSSNRRPSRIARFEQFENRLLMAADLDPAPTSEYVGPASTSGGEAAGESSFASMDTNRDGKVSALDALMVINFLNQTQNVDGETVGNVVDIDVLESRDVNSDGRVTAADALIVINSLDYPDPFASIEESTDEQADAATQLTSGLFIQGYSFVSLPAGGCSCGGLGCAACIVGVGQEIVTHEGDLPSVSSETTEQV